jgi:hypothetical protein
MILPYAIEQALLRLIKALTELAEAKAEEVRKRRWNDSSG